MQKESRREILAFFIIGISAFLWVCLLSHHPGDSLGSTEPIQNACGPAGAFLSFRLILWFGTLGAYCLGALMGTAGLVLLFRHDVSQLGWKILGAILLVLALSSLEVALSRGETLPETIPGGYYGQFVYGFLFSQLSNFGTYLVLTLTVLVAFLISTDTVVYPVLARAGGVIFDGRRWSSLGDTVKERAPLLTRVRIPLPRVRWEWTKGDPATGKKGRKGGAAAEAGGKDDSSGSDPALDPAKSRTRATPQVEPDDESEEDDSEEALEDEEAEDGGEDLYEEEDDDSCGIDDRPPLKIQEEKVQRISSRKRVPQRTKTGPYRLPPLDLLDKPSSAINSLDRAMFEQTAAKIEETLMHFKIEARVVEVQRGPTITQYELALAAGIKVHKIMNLSDDLAMALKAPSIRIVAPIPGKSTVGIEVPNKTRSTVCLRELLDASEFRDEDHQLPLALGKDVAGTPVIADLGDMPHLLIAGSTGSGKSVCINSIITNLLLTRTPDEVKLILVDPKMVELAQFENIPHLLAPVVTDMKKAPAILGWTVDKMEERYELLAMAGVRHLTSYNALGREKLHKRLKEKVNESEMEDFPERLPWIVVIIDELADLMMAASKEVETSITRLSQKSRAVGIHVILATQRPSVDVITGLIKANMPSRVSFHVASKVDSRTILDRNGSEKLLGKGDMLYLPPGTSALCRVQGTYISDREIRDVVEYSVRQAEPQFSPELTRFGVDGASDAGEEDELYEDAVRTVLGSRRGSVTLLQRQLQIGYTRASRLMELMHEHGLVGPFKGSKAREVYYTLEEWEQAKEKRVAANETAEEPEEAEEPAKSDC